MLGGAVASVVVAFLIAGRIGFTFMPDYDAGEFNVSYRVQPGARVEYVVGKGMALDGIVKRIPEVEFTYLSVGGGGGRGSGTGGQLFVRLKPQHDRTRSMAEIQNALRPQLRNVSAARASIDGTRSIFGGYRQPIVVNVQGPEPARLKLVASQVMEVVRNTPGMAEPTSSDQGDIPQLDVRVDRQLAWAAGLGVGAIAGTLQPLFSGTRATLWQDQQGYTHDVRVVYPDSLRSSAEDVGDIPVTGTAIDARTGLPAAIPLSQVADVRAGVGPQQIERRQLERQISISAGVLPGAAVGDVYAATLVRLDSLVLPAGYRTVFTGDVQNLNETKGYVLEAIVLAIVFIYLILASLFGSFVQPLAIMLSLPLSLLGVSLALLITGGTLNVMSMIGIIMLMGLVTKNGILLIDFVNQRAERGEGPDGGDPRSRPDPPPADHHDHRGDDLRHAAAGPGDRRGRRAAVPDGPRRHRRAHHLHPAHALRGAGGVHPARRFRPLVRPAARRRTPDASRPGEGNTGPRRPASGNPRLTYGGRPVYSAS